MKAKVYRGDEPDSGVSGRMDKQHAIRKQELTVRERLDS